MKTKVCVCCGELMNKAANPLDRYPNICAACECLAEDLEAGPQGRCSEWPDAPREFSVKEKIGAAIEPDGLQRRGMPAESVLAMKIN